MSSSTEIVESRDKGFVLNLKLLFTIVDCFSGRFPPRFFTVKLVGFIGFPGSSYLVLFIFFVQMFCNLFIVFTSCPLMDPYILISVLCYTCP